MGGGGTAFYMRIVVGLVLSMAAAWVGYHTRSLSRSGAFGAIFVGTVVLGLGGWIWCRP